MGPINEQIAHFPFKYMQNSQFKSVIRKFDGPFRNFDGPENPLYAPQSKTNDIFAKAYCFKTFDLIYPDNNCNNNW